jgi:putative ABC transport system permease protein
MLRFLPLIASNLRRRSLRTAFTLASIAVAFLLYGLLAAVKNGFEAGAELAGADRLITIHKVSLVQPLPASYQSRIAATPGVSLVTHSTWFGGRYRDDRGVIQAYPVEPEAYLQMYPEYVLSAEDRSRWLQDRSGVLVGRALAERFGWKKGERIPIRSDIYSRENGNYTWEFVIDGIFENRDPSGDTGLMLFHYDYFDEARTVGKGQVGWYIVRIADAAQASRISREIDRNFANSPAETKTGTEKAFVQSFAQQTGDVGAIVIAIGIAVFFTMLLVSGNTMAQAVRERTSELAVMKTLGYTDGQALALVLGESLLVTVAGGVVGLLGALLLVSRMSVQLSQYLSSFVLTGGAIATGFALMLILGCLAGLLPALRASRLGIAEALRR